MQRSTDRILTTHVGSLVRPPALLDFILRQIAGLPYDQAAFEATLRQSVKEVVARQAEVGIDVPSDGEFSKSNFLFYVSERLSGLEQIPAEQRRTIGTYYAGLISEFPGFMEQYNGMYRSMWLAKELDRDLVDAALKAPFPATRVVDKIGYRGQAELARDLANFKEALAGHAFADAFVPSATPSRNDADPGHIYASEEAYLYDLADAMHVEYQAIVDAGYVVQLDLGLPARNQSLPGVRNPTAEQLRRASELQVEAYNHALRGIPPEKVRYHLCWGSMNTPHTMDIPLKEFIDIILKINAGAYSIEAANPRHEHEWKVWQEVVLPEDKILIPGVISHSTNVVEHPELIADRIRKFASAVGRERVIASTDCGFSQGWDMQRMHVEVQWAKLASLAEGARLASADLWS